MHKLFRWLLPAFLILGEILPSSAQELEDFLSVYNGTNREMYMQPLGDVLESGLNTGFFHTADIPKMGFTIELGVSAMFTFVPNSAQTFMARPEGGFVPADPDAVPVSASTIIGPGDAVRIEGEGGTAYSFPGGIGLNSLPLAVPQLRIGALYGTDLTLRFMALDLDENFGSLGFFGLGVRHSVSQYLPETLPVDIAVAYYYQSLILDNLLETQTNFINAQASIKKGPLLAYTGLGYGFADTIVDHTTNEGNIYADLATSSSFRALLGIALEFGPVFIKTDYNFGNMNVWNVGLGFSLDK